jgi:hypothetical protein
MNSISTNPFDDDDDGEDVENIENGNVKTQSIKPMKKKKRRAPPPPVQNKVVRNIHLH